MSAADALTELILKIFRVNGRLLAAGDALTKPFGQSSSRWQVMGAIAESPASVSDIARVMGLSRQSVQRTADLLVGEGSCEYLENPRHARSPLVKLTKAGEKTLRRIGEKQEEWVEALARGLSEKEIEKAMDLLDSVSKKL